jgi:hypothetical protein
MPLPLRRPVNRASRGDQVAQAGDRGGSRRRPAPDPWDPYAPGPRHRRRTLYRRCGRFRSPKDYMRFPPRGCECMTWQADFGRLAW